MQLADQNKINMDRTEKYILSVRLQNHGWSFSIHDPLTDGSFYYQQEQFDSGKTYYQALEEAVYTNDFLLQDFRKIYVLFTTPRFTWVPQALSKECDLENFYRFCYPDSREKIVINRLIRNAIYAVFGVEADIYAFLNRTFGAPIMLHHLSPLCEFFHNKSQWGNFTKMYVQFQTEGIDISVFNTSGLLFANTFRCNSVENMLYFILSVWQQLGLDQQKDELQFAGITSLREKCVEQLKQYIYHVVPVVFPPRIYELGKDTIYAPFDLTALTLCEL